MDNGQPLVRVSQGLEQIGDDLKPGLDALRGSLKQCFDGISHFFDRIVVRAQPLCLVFHLTRRAFFTVG